MPRWLVASVIAFVLSCFGFVAVAHGAMHRADPGGVVAAQLQQSALQHEAPADEALDTDEPAALHDESNSDCTEIATGGFQPLVTVFVSNPVPRPAMSAPPSPFLAHPKRPPRGAAFLL